MYNYIRGLKFDETPKYEELYKILRNIAKKNSFNIDNNLDWIKEKKIPKEFEGKIIFKAKASSSKSFVVQIIEEDEMRHQLAEYH